MRGEGWWQFFCSPSPTSVHSYSSKAVEVWLWAGSLWLSPVLGTQCHRCSSPPRLALNANAALCVLTATNKGLFPGGITDGQRDRSRVIGGTSRGARASSSGLLLSRWSLHLPPLLCLPGLPLFLPACLPSLLWTLALILAISSFQIPESPV